MSRGKCSRCGKPSDKLFTLDDHEVCSRCIYGDEKPFEIYPIGYVRNNLTRSESDFGVKGDKSCISKIELFESQKPFMYRLEEETNLTIVYYLNQSRTVRSVFQRGLDRKEVGVFASRTPDRLTKIAIQDVKLIDVQGTSISVEGLDAIDGTPVLDIKLSHATSV